MADPVIGAASQVTLERALSLASDRIGLLVGFKKDVASMTRSLHLIKGVLADAEAKQNQDGAVQEWLKSLEEVAYDADNVLDELHYESLRHQVESRNRPKLKVCCFFSFSNINLALRWRMASKVRDIKLKLNGIYQDAQGLGLVSRAAPAVGDTRGRQTDSVVAPMVGRADDESEIVNILLSLSEKVVSVLPIVGMGGLGKTTLAKSIYNNHQIDEQFKKKLWVCVSKKVPIEELFKLILGQLKKDKKDEVGDRQNIVQEIGKELGKLRYLLVLDDVWDDNQALWEDFFNTLKGLNPTNGSWCLVTTRPGPVAQCVSRVLMMENEAYRLGRLPDDLCWSILKEKVVGGGEYYLEILLQSSLLEEIRNFWGRRCYKMHDMVHDVAKSIMSKSTKFINSETASGDNSNQVRCLVINSFGEDAKNLFESRSNLLHTLFLSQGSLSDDMLMKLKNLHVLNLSGKENQNLPISIGKLIHLRYINFERSRSQTLPKSVSKLYNLETLRLRDFYLKVLPKGMCDLISLRHLHYYTTNEEFQMPLEMGRLTCLQTLEFFNANLFRLELKWAYNREGDNYNDEDVLDGLRPHPNLEELVICNFMGDQFPRSLMELPTTTTLPKSATTLPKLARLEFNCCDRCRELLPLQNFTSLKELVIYHCDGLTNLPGDMLHSCASLQKLRVIGCDNLISFPLNLQQTPSLLELELRRCPKLKTSMTPKGFGFLTSLWELTIGPFSDDGDDHENSSIYNEFDWSGLISSSSSSSSSALCELALYGLSHMESLPPQIQYLTTLMSLTLCDFGGIKALPDWFGNFAALEELWLYGFKELGHLPSEVAMRCLTKLKRLEVYGSPLLKERCTPESSGPDSQWCKVSHIQDLHITDDCLQ
ncbi:unnamed protein product [Coffea canephora]|uniref:DH200=94 genomic scaffold, scaffold_2177 n=1 Tax=Coffea canephora TaxID=49390 RepID=A0A068VJG5_COFCA|nr:unnamed protein product [Coffea canephora]